MSIRTKLHVIAEMVDIHSITFADKNYLIQRMLKASSYVIDKPVLDLLKRSDVMASIRLLVTHELACLPANPMVIEFEPDEKFHEFVLMEEGKADATQWENLPADAYRTINCWVGIMHRETGAAIIQETAMPISFSNGMLVTPDPNFMPRYKPTPLGATGMRAPNDVEELMLSLAAADVTVAAAAISVQLALLMLNTQGIEREVIDVPALNKARAKKGKPAVPRHTIVHIGRIYRRDGTSIATGAIRGPMPMHFRQAHVRNVRYGPRSDEPRHRPILIPACIVNYDPELPEPRIKREVRV